MLRFVQPWWLTVAVASLLPVAIAVWGGRGRRKIGPVCVVCRSLGVVLIAVVLARPELLDSDGAERPWLVLRDVSASLGEQGGRAISLHDGIHTRVQPFADKLLIEGQKPTIHETNLSAALRLTAAEARGNRIAGAILLTDGQFHDNWSGAAKLLRDDISPAKLPFLIVPLDAPPPDARVADFRVFRPLGDTSEKPGATRCNLRVTVDSNVDCRRIVTVSRLQPTPGRLFEKELRLSADRPVTLRLSDSIPTNRAGEWKAKITPTDAIGENDAMTAALWARKGEVAVVAAEGSLQMPGSSDLQKMNVTRIQGEDAPNDPVGWANFTAVILADTTGQLLNPLQRKALSDYVRRGGGLVLIGCGPHDTPADRLDPLNRIAPLVPNPFERSPLALVVMLDASGSMAEQVDANGPGGAVMRKKFDLAAEAVASLRQHLTPADRLKVITFCDKPKVVYDSGGNPPNFVQLRDALSGVTPAGPTEIAPALVLAAQSPPSAGLGGIVLILSDLATGKFDVSAEAERFTKNKWRLAVIATGAAGDSPQPAPLETLTRWLKAPLLRREHLQALAEVFGRLCREGRGAILRRGDFKIAASDAWAQLGSLKTLRTYVLTARAPDAQLLGGVDGWGDPLLGWRRAGLGRSFSLAVSPIATDNPQWSRGRGLEAWKELLDRMVQLAAGPDDDPRFEVQTDRRGGDLTLLVRVRQDGKNINDLELTAVVQTIDGKDSPAIETNLEQIAPGTYRATVLLPEHQQDALGVQIRRRSDGIASWRGVIKTKYPREFAELGADWETLRQLSRLTGGRIVSVEELQTPALTRQLLTKVTKPRPVWSYFLVAAVALMLLSWIIPRITRRD